MRSRRRLFVSLALALGLGAVLLALTRTLIVRWLAQLAGAARRLEEGGSVDIDVAAVKEAKFGIVAPELMVISGTPRISST